MYPGNVGNAGFRPGGRPTFLSGKGGKTIHAPSGEIGWDGRQRKSGPTRCAQTGSAKDQERPTRGPNGRRWIVGQGSESFKPMTSQKDNEKELAENMNKFFRKASMTTLLRGIMVLMAVSGLVGCSDSYSWHQKLTLEVQTPEGVVSGGSVVEVRWATGSDVEYLPGATNAGSQVRGEATVVEVVPGRYLFALLEGAQSLAQKIFPETKKHGVKVFGPILQATRKTATVPRTQYPMLVTFSDITDPKTVQQVDPENLAATFGPGVLLKRITLEITDEPMTEGKIQPVLKWLDSLGGKGLDGSSISSIDAENRLANILDRSFFKTGN